MLRKQKMLNVYEPYCGPIPRMVIAFHTEQTHVA